MASTFLASAARSLVAGLKVVERVRNQARSMVAPMSFKVKTAPKPP